jgi:hypothetical protein
MKMPRPRFTTRRLMVAVAIVALSMGTGLWVIEMRARSASYLKRAFEFHGQTLRVGSTYTKDGRRFRIGEDENTQLQDEWARKLARKYRRLSDYPWLPVDPDPLPPERLAHPRAAAGVPVQWLQEEWDYSMVDSVYSNSPWWTFLWTWRPR